MVVIRYTFVNTLLENKKTELFAATLPLEIRRRVDAYRHPQDRLLRLAGKMLLADCVGAAQLRDLSYDASGKPFLAGVAGSFSIAHSKELAVCAYCERHRPLGIDAEFIRPLELQDVWPFLTREEEMQLRQSADAVADFYQLWTRKEAAIKAVGRGLATALRDVDASRNPVRTAGQTLYWHALNLSRHYAAHFATDCATETIDCEEAKF